jgi:hypothetical protein
VGDPDIARVIILKWIFEARCDCEDIMEPTRDSVERQAFVNTMMNVTVLQKQGAPQLTWYLTRIFSRKIRLLEN